MEEVRYHIYLKNRCVEYNLTEEEFQHQWSSYNHLTEIHSALTESDISFERVVFNKADYSLQGI